MYFFVVRSNLVESIHINGFATKSSKANVEEFEIREFEW